MTAQPQQADLDLDAFEQPAPEPSLLPRVAAELFGTFVLVTAIIVTAAFGTLGASSTPLHIALAGGLALTAMVVAFGSVSGAHLNPAVSLGAAIAGRLSWADLVPYIVAQTLGAVAAGGLLRVITPSALPTALGIGDVGTFISGTANGFGDHSPIAALSQGQVTFSTAQALVIEAVATAVLVAVVLAATRRPHPGAPLAIGATLTIAILVAAQVTNAAINPARATGTALFAEPWAIQQLWLFWVAPLLGGVIAGLVALLIQRATAPEAAWDEDDDDDWDEDDDDEDVVAVGPSAATALPEEDLERPDGDTLEAVDPDSDDDSRKDEDDDEDGDEFIAGQQRD
ncbi:aquaporin [Pseudactinotalea terrae]|uniref:aquaporin n=1 Tax=Pseudactinotalea terrae TaxID=1743262 RepID=UPI0013918100|nr:aquaporin [Pseudactinotalea terrae]